MLFLMEIIANSPNGIPPAMLKAWAIGSIKTRTQVDDLTIEEVNHETPHLLYTLKREKVGSSRLSLFTISATTGQTATSPAESGLQTKTQ